MSRESIKNNIGSRALDAAGADLPTSVLCCSPAKEMGMPVRFACIRRCDFGKKLDFSGKKAYIIMFSLFSRRMK